MNPHTPPHPLLSAITLPNGRHCRLGVYLRAWRTLKTLPTAALVDGFTHGPVPPALVLAELQRGIHDRINRHVPGFGKGRKWDWVWQSETLRAAIKLNTPRLAIHWLPVWLRARFAGRLA